MCQEDGGLMAVGYDSVGIPRALMRHYFSPCK